MKVNRYSYRLKVEGGHTRITIWVNGGNAGEITFRNEEVPHFIRMLELNSQKEI